LGSLQSKRPTSPALEVDMRLEFIAWVGLGFLIGAIFYYTWTKPYNERLYEIMDCMEEIGDTSQRGYRTCAESLSQ